jgi:NAD(P)-dependent dehydrogenase (short-subunit alcohol dehydrogenase family)
MRVSLIGATGNAGSRILAELAQRGHQVTAVVRNPERVPRLDGVIAKECDANRVDDLAPVLRGHDVVVSSVHFLDCQADKLIDAVRQARVPRYVVVGGAGSLDNGESIKLIDAGGVPEELAVEAKIFGSEAAVRLITDFMRVVGIESYDHEAPFARVIANSRNNRPRMPPISKTGTNTATEADAILGFLRAHGWRGHAFPWHGLHRAPCSSWNSSTASGQAARATTAHRQCHIRSPGSRNRS